MLYSEGVDVDAREKPGLLRLGTQVLILGLPLIISARLAWIVDGELDRVLAAELLVATVGPWAVALGLLLGVAGDSLGAQPAIAGSTVMVRGNSLRMLAVLGVVVVSLGLIEPLYTTELSSNWVHLGAWLAAGACPLWSTALLVRIRGQSRVRALLFAIGLVLVLAGGTAVMGRLLFLHHHAVLAPISAAGVVASIGLYLAVTERVVAPLRRVLSATGILAVGTGLSMTLVLTSAPMGSSWVYDCMAVDRSGARIALLVQEPNTRLRYVELSLADGSATRLPRRVSRVLYAGKHRAEIWSNWWGAMAGLELGSSLCRLDPSGERTCVDVPLEPGTLPIGAHPRRSLVFAGDFDSLVVWDLASDAAWTVERPGRIRWPCLTGGGDLIWRVQMATGPYSHEILRLGSAPAGTSAAPMDVSGLVEELELSHGERCAVDAQTPPQARFIRSRRAIGRVARVLGPGLPPEGQQISEEIGGVSWSGDGRTAALAVGRPRTVRFYREDLGLTDALAAPGLNAPAMSGDGSFLAHRSGSLSRQRKIIVRSVPDARVVLETTTEGSVPDWDGRGRILRIEDGRLRALDPASGQETLLFPL